MMGNKYFEEKGAAAGWMERMTMPLWGTRKVVVVDSELYVLEVFIPLVENGVLGSTSIKNRSYWPKGVPEEEILWNMKNKEVEYVDAVQGSIRGKSYHIMAIKNPKYVMSIIITYGALEHLEGLYTHRRYKG